MRLFDPRDRETTVREARFYAIFELLHTAVDFLAAGLFVVGSILFFSDSTKTAGTWCFLVGSICFALKPTIRLTREIRLASLRHVDRLAEQAPEAPANIFSGQHYDHGDRDEADTGRRGF
jgi:hypothetical protein